METAFFFTQMIIILLRERRTRIRCLLRLTNMENMRSAESILCSCIALTLE